MARPSVMTPEMEDRILGEIASSSRSLESICQDEGMPDSSTVRRHLTKSEEFRTRYARAREDQADILAEEMIEIADNCTDDVTLLGVRDDDPGREVINHSAINRARLQIDTRKWIASKLKPKKYGDKQEVEHSGDVGITWHEVKNYGANRKTDTGS